MLLFKVDLKIFPMEIFRIFPSPEWFIAIYSPGEYEYVADNWISEFEKLSFLLDFDIS